MGDLRIVVIFFVLVFDFVILIFFLFFLVLFLFLIFFLSLELVLKVEVVEVEVVFGLCLDVLMVEELDGFLFNFEGNGFLVDFIELI